MKHLSLLIILCVTLTGCQLIGTPDAVKNMHKAEQVSMKNYASNMDLMVKELVRMYKQEALNHLKYRLDVTLDKYAKAAKDINEYREWEQSEREKYDLKIKEIGVQVDKALDAYSKSLKDYNDVVRFFGKMNEYLNKDSLGSDDFKFATDAILNQLKGQ